jgi:hypothetical protein
MEHLAALHHSRRLQWINALANPTIPQNGMLEAKLKVSRCGTTLYVIDLSEQF